MNKSQAEELTRFWFGEGSLDDGAYVGARMKIWFGKAPEFDAKIKGTFAAWLGQPINENNLLAEILLHDQIPRNAFRDQKGMFAQDKIALELARRAVARKLNETLHPVEVVFLLLPFEHSEALADQDRMVELVTANHARAPEALKTVTASTLDFADRHRDVIKRFGRFPHRNQILGRDSTPEEIEFLKQPGSRF